MSAIGQRNNSQRLCDGSTSTQQGHSNVKYVDTAHSEFVQKRKMEPEKDEISVALRRTVVDFTRMKWRIEMNSLSIARDVECLYFYWCLRFETRLGDRYH